MHTFIIRKYRLRVDSKVRSDKFISVITFEPASVRSISAVAYNPRWMDGQLILTAAAFNRLEPV